MLKNYAQRQRVQRPRNKMREYWIKHFMAFKNIICSLSLVNPRHKLFYRYILKQFPGDITWGKNQIVIFFFSKIKIQYSNLESIYKNKTQCNNYHKDSVLKRNKFVSIHRTSVDRNTMLKEMYVISADCSDCVVMWLWWHEQAKKLYFNLRIFL